MRFPSAARWVLMSVVVLAGCEYKQDKVAADGASPLDGARVTHDVGYEVGMSRVLDASNAVDFAPLGDSGSAREVDSPAAPVCAGTIQGACGPVAKGCIQTCTRTIDEWTCGACLLQGQPCEPIGDAGSSVPVGCPDSNPSYPEPPTCPRCPDGPVCQPLPEPQTCTGCPACNSCCSQCPATPACDSCCPAQVACADAGRCSQCPDAPACDSCCPAQAVGADAGQGLGIHLDSDIPCLGAPGSPEICDGIDNNCNGVVDEGFGKGDSCTVGVGPCQRSGHRVCASDGQSTVCDAEIVQGTAEVCGDGIDNDCDGTVDDGCEFRTPFDVPCGSSVGECRPGTMRCNPVTKTCGACQGAIGPSPEVCDGKDNDCNNLIDDNCQAPTACAPVLVVSQSATPDEGPAAGRCASTQCSLTSPGSVCGGTGWSMYFCLNTCDTSGPWTQCVFKNGSLDQFDADNGNAGTLEVKFCVTTTMHQGLSVWYGTYPRRKKLFLFSAAERAAGVAPGCYTKYFRPQSAACGNFQATDAVDLPIACRKYNWVCSNGQWTNADPTCKFDYDNVPLWLTAEDCQTGYSADQNVQDLEIRYYPQNCDCAAGSACAGGRVCRATSYLLPQAGGADTLGSTYLCRLPE